MQLLTGGYSPRTFWLIWCDSKADGTVRMKEVIYKILVFYALTLLLGRLFFEMGDFMKKSKTLTLTIVGVMTALSSVIYMIFPEIPLVPGVEHLKMDFSDIPAILTGIILGPMPGIAVEVIKNLIHLFRTTTAGIGELMNIGVGSAIILSITFLNNILSKKTDKKLFAALPYFISAFITIGITVFAGWLFNAALTPIYFKIAGIPITAETIFAGVWGSTALNTIKAAFNLLPFYPVYLAAWRTFVKFGG